MQAAPPVIFGDGERTVGSGWVLYSTGMQARTIVGPRSFGRSAVSHTAAAAGDASASRQSEANQLPIRGPSEAGKAPPPLALAPLLPNAVGRVADVQRTLAMAASHGTPLAEVARREEAASGVAAAASASRRACHLARLRPHR